MPEHLDVPYQLAVQALHDLTMVVIDSAPIQGVSEDDVTVLRNVAQILYSHLQELQEREE